MTEDEAKGKWCPQARVLYQIKNEFGLSFAATNAFKGDDGLETRTNCIGSACMWGSDVNGEWRGHCGLVQMPPAVANGPTIPTSILRGKMGDPIGKGVYSNPQPGDPDYPDARK